MRCCLGLSLVLAACGAGEKAASVVILGPTQAAACETITLSVDAQTADWSVDGVPVLGLTREGGQVSFRAPVVDVDTALTFTATGTADGTSFSVDHTVELTASPTVEGYGEAMAADCGPFSLGVASGDPTPDGVLLWTRADPPPSGGVVSVDYAVYADVFGEEFVVSGTVEASAETDHTVMVEISGLEADTMYWYRFETADGASVLGRTRTAHAPGPLDHLRFGVVSCSKGWAGHLNAYDRLAWQDVDFVLHLGDYVYNKANPDKEFRQPTGFDIVQPETVDAWRERYRYQLHDVRLRRVRQAHPFRVIWDNHESDTADEPTGALEVMREYVPMDQPDPADHRIGYRAVQLGDLAHLVILDQQIHRVDGDRLGETQWAWLDAQLDDSTARWRILGSQGLMTHLDTPDIPSRPSPSDLDDYPETRARLFGRLAEFDGNLVVTGDLHFALVADMVLDPSDPDSLAAPVGGELLPTGVSSPNFDENLCGGPCDDATAGVIEGFAELYVETNPHLLYADFMQHGYGVVDVTPERVEAAIHYTPILEPSEEETVGAVFEMTHGTHGWTRVD